MTGDTMSYTLHFPADTQAAIALGDDATITMALKGGSQQSIIVSLPADLAVLYADHFAHRTDLLRARAFLAEIDDQGGVHLPLLIQPGGAMSVVFQALWLSALGATMKCFQFSESREKLDPATVFGADTEVRATFDLLKKLRNKHVLHHDNDWMQTVPYAVIGDAGSQAAVIEVGCVVLEGTDTAHVGQLRTVVDAALDWITREIDRRTEAISANLQGRDDLLALPPPPGVKTPHTGSIGKPRPRPVAGLRSAEEET
jgi:hypothetical protein